MSDLEEERRKLRLEVKFRAKYHGKTALEMGLSPEQLLLLEEYVEGLKGGRNPEERLVTQLQQRVSGGSWWMLLLQRWMLLGLQWSPGWILLSATGGDTAAVAGEPGGWWMLLFLAHLVAAAA